MQEVRADVRKKDEDKKHILFFMNTARDDTFVIS
jgi:hypothetical protein